MRKAHCKLLSGSVFTSFSLRLLAEVEGRELPTELPKSNPSAGNELSYVTISYSYYLVGNTIGSGSAPAALGGSDPLPGT